MSTNNVVTDTLGTVTVNHGAFPNSVYSVTMQDPNIYNVPDISWTGLGTLSISDSYNDNKSLKVVGNAEFDGDITLRGKSLVETIDKIEERLAILHPNAELEDRWKELKELGRRYRELEADIIEKESIWNTLKK